MSYRISKDIKKYVKAMTTDMASADLWRPFFQTNGKLYIGRPTIMPSMSQNETRYSPPF